MDFKAHPGQRHSYKEESTPMFDMFSLTRPLNSPDKRDTRLETLVWTALCLFCYSSTLT